MRDINDYFEGESYPSEDFRYSLEVVPLEDAKRIAVDYAEQFKPKWIHVSNPPEELGHYIGKTQSGDIQRADFYESLSPNCEGLIRKFQSYIEWYMPIPSE